MWNRIKEMFSEESNIAATSSLTISIPQYRQRHHILLVPCCTLSRPSQPSVTLHLFALLMYILLNTYKITILKHLCIVLLLCYFFWKCMITLIYLGIIIFLANMQVPSIVHTDFVQSVLTVYGVKPYIAPIAKYITGIALPY